MVGSSVARRHVLDGDVENDGVGSDLDQSTPATLPSDAQAVVLPTGMSSQSRKVVGCCMHGKLQLSYSFSSFGQKLPPIHCPQPSSLKALPLPRHDHCEAVDMLAGWGGCTWAAGWAMEAVL
jgi:hypothetical protein